MTTLPPSVSRLSKQCRLLNISQSYRPPRPVTGIALLTLLLLLTQDRNNGLKHYIIYLVSLKKKLSFTFLSFMFVTTRNW
jgi:hypothetical protein